MCVCVCVLQWVVVLRRERDLLSLVTYCCFSMLEYVESKTIADCDSSRCLM